VLKEKLSLAKYFPGLLYFLLGYCFSQFFNFMTLPLAILMTLQSNLGASPESEQRRKSVKYHKARGNAWTAPTGFLIAFWITTIVFEAWFFI
jgi:hypothetical protein